MKKTKLLFTEAAVPFILEAFGKSVNQQGTIVDTKTKRPVLDMVDRKPMKASELGGIVKVKGKPAFVKQDLHSMISMTEILKKQKQ